jgi:hypothetical protein
LSQKTAEPNEPLKAGSSESPHADAPLGGWVVPAMILGGCVLLGLVLRSAPETSTPAVEEVVTEATPEADWTIGPGVETLVKIVDRRQEPWPATLTRRGVTRAIPEEGLKLRAPANRTFGRLGGDRLASKDWRPDESDTWAEQPDGSFVATVMLYPGRPLDVDLVGPGAAIVGPVRCIDGHRRGVACEGSAPNWTCDCRTASRIAVYANRWSVPWVASRSRFEDGPTEVPGVVTACFEFPEVPPGERTVVVIAPQGMPLESAMEADSRSVAEGLEICVRTPTNEPLLIGLGGSFSPSWSARDAEAPPGVRTWTTRPVTDGTIQLSPDGGWASWPVHIGPKE